MNLTEEDISPEFVGCVLTCLSGGGIDDSRVVFMCLAGCYASTYLRDDQTGHDQEDEQDQPEDENESEGDDDDSQPAQLQREIEEENQPGKQYEDTEFSLEDIEGLGATYADRLREHGIGTCEDLMQTRPETVAEVSQVSERRAAEWIQKAQNHQ